MDTDPEPATIVVRRPRRYFGSARGILVRVDGRKVGKVRFDSAMRFTVEPGEHRVEVSMDWTRSRPARVVTEPGSRTELVIGSRPGAMLKLLAPGVLFAVLPLALFGERMWGGAFDAHWWLRWPVILAVQLSAFWTYALAARALVRDFWVMWTLEPAAGGPPELPKIDTDPTSYDLKVFRFN